MRVIYQTSPTPTAVRQPPDDKIVDGYAYFQAILHEPTEQVPEGRFHAVSYWQERTPVGQPLRLTADRLIGLSEVLIPESVLRPLPASGRLELAWTWTRKIS